MSLRNRNRTPVFRIRHRPSRPSRPSRLWIAALAVFAGAVFPGGAGRVLAAAGGQPDFIIDPPAPAAGAATVDAARFGVDENNSGEENEAAFRRALDHCRETGAARLTVPRGRYRIGHFVSGKGSRQASGGIIELRDFRDFTFDAQGARFVFGSRRDFFVIDNCERVLVTGFTMDWDRDREPPQSHGIIRRVDPAGNFIEVEFPDGQPPVGPEMTFYEIIELDPVTLDVRHTTGKPILGVYFMDLSRTEQVRPGVLRFYYHANRRGPGWPGRQGYAPGQHYLFMRLRYESHGIVLRNFVHGTLSDITIHGTRGHGIVGAEGSHHYRIRRVRMLRAPGRAFGFSSAADGIHIGGSSGWLKIEDCELAQNGDDCVNVHDNFPAGVKRSPDGRPDILVHETAPQWRYRFEPGDLVELRNADLSPAGFLSRVVNVDYKKGGGFSLTLADPLPSGPGSGPVRGDGGFALFNRRFDSGHYRIRNNVFRDNRGRGLLIRTHSGVIEKNRFVRTFYPGLHVSAGYGRYGEGYGPENIVIRDNRFEDTGSARWEGEGGEGSVAAAGDLAICVETPAGIVPARLCRNIVVENNRFVNSRPPEISVSAAENILIRGNRFARPVRDGRRKTSPGVVVTHSAHVVDQGNIIEPIPASAVSTFTINP
ncbi:MAG: right-handed parallel beta-helix repeat-containing protein [Opitutaceae bacterium]|jgi:hypothetical protein|nr:right-handed parallel beta-helix repeat-containing protein [Opitutaceae bacterium]